VEKLVIEKTKSTPSILLDPATDVLEIRGESYPENAAKFYSPLFARLRDYLALPGAGPVTVDMEIIYFNSSSSKIFFNLFELLSTAAAGGREVVVNWRFHEDNETAEECGEEFMEDAPALAFNLIRVP
jgi:hypothetical protein